MACCPTEEKYGYDDKRFQKDVDENFHCSICYNVLKDPRMCQNNEHMFCLACITQHLNVNSECCPECNEHLSVHTLRRARVVNKMLSKLKINCDYASRGCLQIIYLEELETHVANCGYAPVLCSSPDCGIEINKQDKVHHESEVCGYRRLIQGCGQIQETMKRVERNLLVMNRTVEACKEVKKFEQKMNENFATLTQMNLETKNKVEAVKAQMQSRIREVRKEVKDVKENLSKISKDVAEVKVMLSQVLEVLNKPALPTDGMMNTRREDGQDALDLGALASDGPDWGAPDWGAPDWGAPVWSASDLGVGPTGLK